jgi:hypothetical protein
MDWLSPTPHLRSLDWTAGRESLIRKGRETVIGVAARQSILLALGELHALLNPVRQITADVE